MSPSRRQTAHDPAGWVDRVGVRQVCDVCGRAATWRRRRTGRPTARRCGLCHSPSPTAPHLTKETR